jgi:hypothetical protein
MPKISKRIVDATGAGKRRVIVWDDQIKGFGLLVLPSGVKSYILIYRTPEGRQRQLTLGKHGALTPEQARKLAAEHKHAISHGADPLAERRATRAALTVGDMLDAYLESDEFKDKAEVTQACDRGRIERHLRPLLGKRHAHLLTEGDVRKAFAAIREEGPRLTSRPASAAARWSGAALARLGKQSSG